MKQSLEFSTSCYDQDICGGYGLENSTSFSCSLKILFTSFSVLNEDVLYYCTQASDFTRHKATSIREDWTVKFERGFI